jgi:alpha-tubulin suppressor-like RCC1 family protein
VIAIAAGAEHSLALRSDGSVWAWGSNTNGKLGDGTTSNRLTPTATLLTSGITAIAAGYMNSVALRGVDGVVLSWGINETGQLGNGSTSPGFRSQPFPVISLTGVVEISFGSGGLGHGLALLSNGTVWAWGDNQMGNNNSGTPLFGRLGNGSSAPFSATPVQVTGLNLN